MPNFKRVSLITLALAIPTSAFAAATGADGGFFASLCSSLCGTCCG